jgi:GAF domain-containing protein
MKQDQQQITHQRLMSFYELTRRMHDRSDLHALLEFVLDTALRLTHARRGFLLLNDDHKRNLHQVTVVRGEDMQTSQNHQIIEDVLSPVIKDVFAQHMPHMRASQPPTEQSLPLNDKRSAVAVPLKEEEKLVGVLYLDHTEPDMFGQDDRDFLHAFGSQAILVANQLRRHQRQVEDLMRLNELSRSVVEVLDVDEVLARIIQEATRMLQVETGAVLLLNEAEDELHFAISISNGQRGNIPTHLNVNQGIAGRVVSTGIPACVRDVHQDKDWFGEVENGFTTRSLLCVPLRKNERIIGALQVLNKKGSQGFNEEDTALLSAFAASATIAIENARLYQEARQAHQLRALNTMALALNSTLDIPTILSTGLHHALDMVQTATGGISLHVPALHPLTDTMIVFQGSMPAPPETLLEQCLSFVLHHSTDEAILLEASDANTNDATATITLPQGSASLALVPLQPGGTTSGVLVVLHQTPPSQRAETLNILNSIARIIDLAVQNATHSMQAHNRARHLAYLHDIGSALTSSLDLTHILQIIIDGVNALLETERTSVFLIDTQTSELVLRYSNEGPADIRLAPPWQGIAGWVATHDHPAIVNDPLRDTRHLRKFALDIGYEAHSLLCVPLKVEGHIIGVVEALNKIDGQPFNQHHQNLLTELTRWAAIAIHNARLYDERVQAYEHLAAEQKRRVAAETRGAMAAVVLDIAHTMNNIIGAIRAWTLTLEQQANREQPAPLARPLLAHIRQNAEEAIDLIRTMRGPLEHALLTPTDVHTCLEHAIQSCWWPHHIQLSLKYTPGLPAVQANNDRLEAVFQNILANAIQAITHEDGKVHIATNCTTDGQVQVQIQDNGPGIAPEVQEQLFMPGVSKKDGSLGIGLWLVETFIQQFGGTITWHNNADTGTTFTITLPPMTPVVKPDSENQ